ncbi:hypothetical protein ASPFODRAFT_108377, partial [Aspergillus luchuensis CBS 106.47]
GNPEMGHVRRRDGKDINLSVSEYIVKPVSYQTHSWISTQSINHLTSKNHFY